jgi:hypothetical protein
MRHLPATNLSVTYVSAVWFIWMYNIKRHFKTRIWDVIFIVATTQVWYWIHEHLWPSDFHIWQMFPKLRFTLNLKFSFNGVYLVHQISTRYTWPGELHTERGTDKQQYEDRKRTDILKTPQLRIMTTYINEYYWRKWERCSRFHQNVLPEDGPGRPKHVARHNIYIYINDILVSWM